MYLLAGVLGEVKAFRKVYQNPILHAREPDAPEKVPDLQQHELRASKCV
jgi:hypothetical protein